MEHTPQDKLMLFASNSQTIKREFVWQNDMTRRLAAMLYAQEGKAIDCDAIRQCHTLIKQNTGVFSAFRGDMALCLAALLSLSPNPESLLSETLKVYDLLKSVKFHASDFLVIAAYQIAARADATEFMHVVIRTRAFYDGMKARHLFITGQDDEIFAAMLGLADLDVATGTEHIEQVFSRIKGEFSDKNSVQTLAQILVLGSSDDNATNRVLALRDALREQKIKLDKSYTLPSLGILALLPVDIDTIVRDIDEAQSTLREQKGFGGLSVSTQELLLYAVAIVTDRYAKMDGMLTSTLSTSITNIIIAEQTMMIAMICAFSVSSSAASSSSSST